MSTRAFSRYVDGYFGAPRRISRTPREYPFRLNGDVTTCMYSATYLVDQGKFTPTAGGTVDPETAGMYLLAESKPEIVNGDLATFVRVYGNVPTDQVTYGTQVITKPPFPTADYLGYWVDSLLNTTLANVWSVAIASASVGRYITGGTFTVTYKTSTTAPLAWNAADATIAAAVNALADMVTDATTVSAVNLLGSAGTCALTRASGSASLSNITSSGASLTPACVHATGYTGVTGATVYAARSAVNVQKTSHGLSAAQAIRHGTATNGGGTLTTVNTYVDANNFTIANASAFSPINPVYYRTHVRTYTPGSDRVGVRLTQKFYLAGVTSGITTPADIPVPATLINEADLLGAVVANATGYQDYDATELTRYNDSAIHTQTLIAIDMADL